MKTKVVNTNESVKGILSIEHLHHFRCGLCNRWWSIGDPSVGKKLITEFFCPWCGKKNIFESGKEISREF